MARAILGWWRLKGVRTVALACLLGLLSIPVEAPAGESPESKAAAAYDRGARALRQGDSAAAAEHLERALEFAPSDTQSLALYSRALLEQGRTEEAIANLEKLRAIDPDATDVHFLLAMAHFRLGQWEAARDQLLEARERQPNEGRVHLLLGRAYQELGDNESAERALVEAARIDPALLGPVAYRRGLLALEQQKLVEAREFFEEVNEKMPNSTLARSAEAYIKYLESGAGRRWNAWVTLGAAHDTNVNLVGQGAFTASTTRERDQLGILDFGMSARLWNKGKFGLRGGFDGGLTYHTDQTDFDVDRSRGWLVGTVQFTERVAADLRYEIEGVWTDFASFRRNNVIEPALRIAPASGFLTRIFWRYDDRSFYQRVTDNRLDRDGNVSTLGIDEFFPFPEILDPFDWGQGFVRLGYRHRTESTSGSDFDSQGHAPVVTLGVPMPEEVMLLLDGSWEWRRYKEPSVFELTGGKRRDRIFQTRVALRRPIGDWVTMEASWRRVRWYSNVDLFDFRRHIVSLLATLRY